MSYCVAFCFTCCPKASYAYATSKLPRQPPPRCTLLPLCFQLPLRRDPQVEQQASAAEGTAPSLALSSSVADPWWFSRRDLLRPNSSFVLRPGSPESRHETPIPILLARCLPTPTGLVRFRCPSTRLLASSFRSQTTIEPSLPALRLPSCPIPRVFLTTATPLNLHKRFLTGGFLQTAVSDPPPHDLPNLPAFLEWGASDTALAFLDSCRGRDDHC